MESNDVAVVYLARHAEGVQPINDFVNSWKRHAPGMACKLVVVWKGFPGQNPSCSAQKRAFTGLHHESITMTDSGFDLSAYQLAARSRPESYLVFLNTFSTIESDDWVRKLYEQASASGAGMVSATASFESVQLSMKSMSKAVWLAIHNVPYDPLIADQWGHEIIKHAPGWLAKDHPLRRARGGLYWRARRIATSLIRGRKPPPMTNDRAIMEDAFEETWLTAGRAYRIFPTFPNPHLRSNAFMVRREMFLKMAPKPFVTKEDSFNAESGYESFSRQIYGHGLECLVVGADGRGFASCDWSNSNTFRRGDQSNKLVADNQTRAFDRMNSAQRALYESWTWGPIPEERLPPLQSLPNPMVPLQIGPHSFI